MPEKSVSILKESRLGERRVILLPEQVKHFINADFKVYIAKGAGQSMGYDDHLYASFGAKIVEQDEAWQISSYVLKYKAPTPDEFKYFHNNLHLGAWFHAEGNQALTLAICQSGMTAYSYEFFQTTDGIFPMSVASSEISGKLAILYGAYHLQSHMGGAGILLADVVGAKSPKIVIIGYGNAGGAAARLAIGLGADVVVLGTNKAKLRQFQATVPSNVKCYLNSPDVLENQLLDADLVIGAIRISTFDTQPMIDENLVKKMKRGSMIIDITCGYGDGYLPTFDHISTFDQPVYERHGVLHCKLNALPAAVPITTNHVISPLLVPYLINLGQAIFDKSFNDPISAQGKIIENGILIHPEVQRHMEMLKKKTNHLE
jgi:alanine dehydrogenase